MKKFAARLFTHSPKIVRVDSAFSNLISCSKTKLSKRTSGFTIVELLIVIVIIAVLATITAVSYTGITQKAEAANLQTDLKIASTQFAMYSVTNNSYPASLEEATAAGLLPASSNTTFQYSLSDGNYCLSATSPKAGDYSYHFSSLVGTIETGVCDGHTAPGIPTSVDAEILVVAGGGGGGACRGGGGGAGGYVSGNYHLDKSSYAITIGAGGTGGSAGDPGQDNATAGGDSSIEGVVTAKGGGKGALGLGVLYFGYPINGGPGGSGGGGSGYGTAGAGGLGTVGQGHDGGFGKVGGEPNNGGGGGGAFAVGGSATGIGGDGLYSDISGVSTPYAGGGGAGTISVAGKAGGVGGGGAGGNSVVGVAGVDGTGGGGGGGGNGSAGASGGSGIVIIRYKTSGSPKYIGGTIAYDGEYTVHTFVGAGTVHFRRVDPSDKIIDLLLVAGGGGGGACRGGGGGAGGLIKDNYILNPGSYQVTIGAGGTGGSAGDPGQDNAMAGSDSSFGDIITAIGGGKGAIGLSSLYFGHSTNGGTGGSGGGGSGYGTAGIGGLGTLGQGRDGGFGKVGGDPNNGGGGGGAVTVGGSATGIGGNGLYSDISGASIPYAGGGGAGTFNVAGKAGGIGGGGAGGNNTIGTAGAANTGGGGGGGGNAAAGASGGSGIAIIRYLTGSMTATGGTITTSGGYTIHTFTSNGTFTVN